MGEYKNEDLQLVQKKSLEILLAIDELCKKYDIDYFLVAGSALGAIRHQGFIPWDDDIDIAMRYNDFQTFKHYANELPEPYKYMDHDCNPEWSKLFAKVEDTSSVFITEDNYYDSYKYGISVDIFPFFNEPRDINERIDWTNRIQYLLKIIDRKNHPIVYRSKSSVNTKIKDSMRYLYSKMILRFVNLDKLWKKLTEETLKYNDKDTGVYGCHEVTFCVEKSELYPIKRIKFENTKLPVPNKCDVYLSRHFGNDYMILPPEDKRHNHAPIKLVVEKQ